MRLGGCDWDKLIEGYLYEAYQYQTGHEIPDDMGFEIQQKALQAKFELSVREETFVNIVSESGDRIIPLYRSVPDREIDEFHFW